ncbi:MRC1 [Bugula neritina]|uniref:MRC1 n=1 Tax=Bugula neritina TaxID=10212 RepID=A0A7J7KCT8_BUGNE|nr:MRC1 [Bugula neritina]
MISVKTSQGLDWIFTECFDSCGSGDWTRHGNTCYKIVREPISSWKVAQGLCLDLGGYLATPSELAEVYWLKGFRSHHKSLRGGWLWMGGYKKNGQWLWKERFTDSAIDHNDWGKDQPYPDPANNCLLMFGDGSEGWKLDPVEQWFRWAAGNCNAKLGFICQKEIETK